MLCNQLVEQQYIYHVDEDEVVEVIMQSVFKH